MAHLTFGEGETGINTPRLQTGVAAYINRAGDIVVECAADILSLSLFTVEGKMMAYKKCDGGDANHITPLTGSFISGAFKVTNNPQTVAVYKNGPFAGDGTSGSPWRITNATDLNKLSELINAGTAPYADANKYYRLENNLNLTIVQNNVTPIGTESKPFKGNFNGNNKTISGITINRTSKETGLFGYIDGGTIQNLGLINLSIQGGSDTGGIVGWLKLGNITGCYVTGTVSGGSDTGGIAGRNYWDIYINSIVENCVALNISVNKTSTGTSTGFGRVVGSYSGSTLTNNAAYSGMTLPDGVSITNNANQKDGIGIVKTETKDQSTYTTRGWGWGTTTASPWCWGLSNSYPLPTLHWQIIPPGDLPAHLR